MRFHLLAALVVSGALLESDWGYGVHVIEVYFSPDDNDAITGFERCSIYPYFDGHNVDCQGADDVRITDRGVLISGYPDYVRVTVEDESGWTISRIIKEPKYEESFPNGKKCGSCRYGTAIMILDGPGDRAGYVQDLYPTSDAPVGEGGAGMGGGPSSGTGLTVGSRCEANVDCALPGFCTNDFLGLNSVCSMSCRGEADCPSGSVCADALLSDALMPIGGYCVRACDTVSDCEPLGSRCGVQDEGHYCF